MKNTKEVKTLLTALYCYNRMGAKDEKIENILSYAFYRLFNGNTNLILVCTSTVDRNELLSYIDRLLEEDTEYHKFIKLQEATRKK